MPRVFQALGLILFFFCQTVRADNIQVLDEPRPSQAFFFPNITDAELKDLGSDDFREREAIYGSLLTRLKAVLNNQSMFIQQNLWIIQDHLQELRVQNRYRNAEAAVRLDGLSKELDNHVREIKTTVRRQLITKFFYALRNSPVLADAADRLATTGNLGQEVHQISVTLQPSSIINAYEAQRYVAVGLGKQAAKNVDWGTLPPMTFRLIEAGGIVNSPSDFAVRGSHFYFFPWVGPGVRFRMLNERSAIPLILFRTFRTEREYAASLEEDLDDYFSRVAISP